MAEDSLPIDIHYNKLLGKIMSHKHYLKLNYLLNLDWLIDRRHCDIRWHHQLRDIKDRVKHGLVNLPRDVLKLESILTKEGSCT